MKNSRWTHIPSPVEHGGTEFDAGWKECYDDKVTPLYTAIENALIDLQAQKQGRHEAWIQQLMADLQKSLKECDKR